MGNKMSGHDDDDMKRVKGRYAGEMLFDDEDDYDDDADDYSDDHGRTGIAKDDYSDSAFGPGADDEEDAASEEEAYTSDDEYYEDEYAEEEQDMKDQKRKKKNRVWGIILAIEVVAAIVIGVLFVKAYINNTYNKMQYKELKDTHINEDLDEETVKKMTGYTNIALFGIDTRDAGMVDEGVRSDSIIICSINNDTQEVKLLSLYRDTYLELCNDSQSYEKAAHAYAYGGAQGAVNMINKNLDLNITDYVAVNFTALTEAIDALGGIDIELKEEELYKLNQCIDEQMGVNGIYSDYVYDTGVVHLNGV